MPGYLSDLRRGAARNALTQHGKPLDPMRGPPEVKPTPESLLQGMPEGWTEMSPEFQALGPAEQDLIRAQASQGPVSGEMGQRAVGNALLSPPDVASAPQTRGSRPGVIQIPDSEGTHFSPPESPRAAPPQIPRASSQAPPAPPAQAAPPNRSSSDRTRRK